MVNILLTVLTSAFQSSITGEGTWVGFGNGLAAAAAVTAAVAHKLSTAKQKGSRQCRGPFSMDDIISRREV